MNKQAARTFILAGDIGGTKTNLGLFAVGKQRPILKAFETYPSREANGLDEIIQKFIEKHTVPITEACFGIAGPVVNGRCKATNLPWEVSEIELKQWFGWNNARLINDLTATALAIPILNRQEIIPINSVRIQKKRNIGLIAPGTGLGVALLICANEQYIPVASEGGHADFPPNSADGAHLWKYLHKQFGHVSIERILSGPGLYNIYLWLIETRRFKESPGLTRKLKDGDPAKAITETALQHTAPVCVKALEMFVSILGSVAGNLVLTGMTTGGLYLGGGIPPKIFTQSYERLFLDAFSNKGRFSKMLRKIPVRIIINDRAALLGAAFQAQTNCKR